MDLSRVVSEIFNVEKCCEYRYECWGITVVTLKSGSEVTLKVIERYDSIDY